MAWEWEGNAGTRWRFKHRRNAAHGRNDESYASNPGTPERAPTRVTQVTVALVLVCWRRECRSVRLVDRDCTCRSVRVFRVVRSTTLEAQIPLRRLPETSPDGKVGVMEFGLNAARGQRLQCHVTRGPTLACHCDT